MFKFDGQTENYETIKCKDLKKHGGSIFVQVRTHLYSFNKTYDQWLCWSNLESNPVTIEAKAMTKVRRNAPLANYKDKFIVAPGGLKNNEATSKGVYSVELYSVKNDSWRDGPTLHYKRVDHSCCTLGDSVYVFGGTGGTDSIESLNVEAFRANPKSIKQWTLIKPKHKDGFNGMLKPIFCPISETEILILGGSKKLD